MNIGIVDWFGGGRKNLDYGFITPLNFSQVKNKISRDIFVHRKKIFKSSKILNPNDVVVFEIQITAKGPEAINVKLATAQNFVELINFADVEDYKTFRAKFRFKPALFRETLAAIPADLFKKCLWLREDLPTVERLNLCVEMYKENLTPELFAEISTLLDAFTSFDWKNFSAKINAEDEA